MDGFGAGVTGAVAVGAVLAGVTELPGVTAEPPGVGASAVGTLGVVGIVAPGAVPSSTVSPQAAVRSEPRTRPPERRRTKATGVTRKGPNFMHEF